jgi:aspartyl protease family protein
VERRRGRGALTVGAREPYVPGMRTSGVVRAALVLLALPALATATELRVVAVTPGQSADVVIDGAAPVTIEVGETVDGVKLLRVDRGGATVSVRGATRTLPLSAGVGAFADAGGGTVTLAADGRGQFFARGTVNGRPVEFIVDTGATLTTLSRADAQRIGLDYRRGTPIRTATANGPASGWRVSLASVSVGDATVRDVDAMIIDNDGLPVALLGMSFLGRFDMHRQGSTLILRRRR